LIVWDTMAIEYKRIGEILIKEGVITESQLKEAIDTQKRDGGAIGEMLVRLGFTKEEDIVVALSKQLGMPYVSLNKEVIQPAMEHNVSRLIPESFARECKVVPLSKTLNSITVAISDPFNLIGLDDVKKMTKCEVNPVLSTSKDIADAIDILYGKKDLLKEAVESSYEDLETDLEVVESKDKGLSLDEIVAKAGEAPVVKLVNLLLVEAVRMRASDIHVESFPGKITIRYRVDGILHEIPPPSQRLLPAIVSRIKILSKMDIAEKRLPQDGSFSVRAEDKVVDLRVSTIPTIHGEKVVMRILDKANIPTDLGGLGFEDMELARFEEAIFKPYGLIFITGPTGSGKTTTLYAGLRKIYTPEKNILTIEDPVEYRLSGINQVQAKPAIGLTFAAGLRAFLRQDPDIIMVGEVRDLETAEICVKASITGHLVFSTLHTNDAVGVISRLIDIGIPPYMLTTSLEMVVAQRLIRKLCTKCKEEFTPSKEILKDIDLGGVASIFRPKGCKWCMNTGYYGRVAVYEILKMTNKMRELIVKRDTDAKLLDEAKSGGMRTLWESAISKVKSGVTTLEEAYRVTLEKEKIDDGAA